MSYAALHHYWEIGARMCKAVFYFSGLCLKIHQMISSWSAGLEPRKHLTLQRQRRGRGLEGLGMCLGPLSSLLLWLRAWWVLSRVRAGKWSWKRLTDVRTVSGPGISMMGNAIGFPLCVGLGMVTGAIVAYVQDSVGTAKFQQLWWPK